MALPIVVPAQGKDEIDAKLADLEQKLGRHKKPAATSCRIAHRPIDA
jgi:hypothetical protein